jgi:hypothetical protein
MLNEFLNSITGDLGAKLSGKVDLNQDKMNGVGNIVTNTLKDGLMDKLKGGQLAEITGLLGKGGSSTPFAGNLVQQTVGNLVSKLGLSQTMSATVAKIAVPFIIEKLGNFASSKGKNNEEGVKELLGDLVTGSVKDKLLGGLGKKFGF